MDFHKMPRSTILHLYLGRLFAPDGRTDGVPISWSAMILITTPSGSIIIMGLESVSASEDVIGDL